MQKLNVERLQSHYRDLKNRKHTKLVIVHMGTCGIASGSEAVLDAVLSASEELGSSGVTIKTSGCAGLCSREPMMTVDLPGAPPVKYCDVDAAKAKQIYAEHVIGGKPVAKFVLGAGAESLH
jgi:NADP-reducing hydrogenase subunit HndB